MSSPNARSDVSILNRARIGFHQSLSHRHRVQVLAEAIEPYLLGAASLLDLGCGDLSLASQLSSSGKIARCVGADIWPALTEPPAGCEYVTIDADARLPFGEREFDVVLLVDTLHHTLHPDRLLQEALRVGRVVIVKDHFQEGRWDRVRLHLLDWMGNAAYGVASPARYFSRVSFSTLVASMGGAVEIREKEIDLYRHLPMTSLLFPPHLHFIARVTLPDVTSSATSASEPSQN